MNTAVIGVVAMAPITKREPVPELPKSSTSPGSAQPPTPVPQTFQAPGPTRSGRAPKARIALAVFSTSSASKRPEMRVSPSASAPRIKARWEIDLSPGTLAVPFRGGDWRALSGRAVADMIIPLRREMPNRTAASVKVFDRQVQPWQTTRPPESIDTRDTKL